MMDKVLIATAEKAIFDSIYFSLRGVVNIDFNDLDLSSVNIKNLDSMVKGSKDERMINKFKGILK